MKKYEARNDSNIKVSAVQFDGNLNLLKTRLSITDLSSIIVENKRTQNGKQLFLRNKFREFPLDPGDFIVKGTEGLIFVDNSYSFNEFYQQSAESESYTR